MLGRSGLVSDRVPVRSGAPSQFTSHLEHGQCLVSRCPVKALHSRPETGRPRSLTPHQERQVFRWRRVVADLIERKFNMRLGVSAVGELLAKLGLTPQKPLQRAYQRDPEAIEAWRRERFLPLPDRQKPPAVKSISGMSRGFVPTLCTARPGAKKGQTPVVDRPGQRQTISAASAVNARGAFWYCTYQGGLNAELFVTLLRRMMRRRTKPVHLVVDGLPAHKTALVKAYVAATDGMLTLHLLPGYAPELNPDELVWSHMKRTGLPEPHCGAESCSKRSRLNSAPSSVCRT